MDFMMDALAEARKAFEEGELPVGCVIVKDGRVIARGRNCRETLNDPTGHAEIAAIRNAAATLGDWRLTGCDMYVTLEPFPMCAGAISQARISRVFFGAYDPAQGCAGSVYRIPEDPAFGHFCRCEGGIMEEECRGLLDEFFQSARRR